MKMDRNNTKLRFNIATCTKASKLIRISLINCVLFGGIKMFKNLWLLANCQSDIIDMRKHSSLDSDNQWHEPEALIDSVNTSTYELVPKLTLVTSSKRTMNWVSALYFPQCIRNGWINHCEQIYYRIQSSVFSECFSQKFRQHISISISLFILFFRMSYFSLVRCLQSNVAVDISQYWCDIQWMALLSVNG